ncbi:hypothetical protein GCM10007916_14170 [Psychromonas marina]|uniref:Uncharacterized protein n=1 Tax=Psychromonas marina TaxID=88364 RepID=A0ABQ6DZD7_9GAMM|nr:hypothetical protein [Psychromonas marina]GLS90350.1 hypothetical protein GCM10007916_14170 [Psychromonas marina]
MIANHLEALNHCPAKRQTLNDTVEMNGLSDKVYIPEDGETITL